MIRARTVPLLALFSFLLCLGAAAPVSARDLQCDDIPLLMQQAFLRRHISRKEMTDELRDRTVEQYIKMTDPSKTLLYEKDVAALRKDLESVWERMKKNDCAVLLGAKKILGDRAAENEAYIRSLMNDEYALDENAEFIIDPDERGFPKTKEEKQRFLRNYAHFQILNYLLADMELEKAKEQLVHRYELITKRIRERSAHDTYVQFMDAFTAALDPHTSFFSADRLEDFEISMRLSLEGIGALLTWEDGYTIVQEIIPGGAADRAKVLKPKDKIIAVAENGKDFTSVIDMDLRDVVKLIRGKKGSRVGLMLLRQGEKTERLEVGIVRDKINLEDQAAKITYETREVEGKKLTLGVLSLPSFYGDPNGNKRSSYEDVKELLEEANKKKVDGILLDLSRNGGGLLEDAVRISGLFLRWGPVVATQDVKGDLTVLNDRDPRIEYSGPLVVLTSRASASGSEILAGALHDYRRAVLVGADHTFGKGTVQTLIPLPDRLGAAKVTTGVFFLPGGASTQHQGVPGDIVLPSALQTDEIGEKTLDNSLPPMKVDDFRGDKVNARLDHEKWKPVTDALIQRLAERSRARVAEDEEFTEIRKEIAEAKKNKGLIRLSEIRRKAEENKDEMEENEKKTTAERLEDMSAPYVEESLNILEDLVIMQ